MIPGLYKIGSKLLIYHQLSAKHFLFAKELATHFNPYSTTVAIWQQGLENFKNNCLTIFLEFQNLLSTLHLSVVECLLTE